MTNALHSPDRRLDRHQDNILASLSRRLEVARAHNNADLVTLLEHEQQQVSAKQLDGVAQAHRSWWQTATQRLTNALFGGSSLQICEVADGSDRWWVASNPQTGQLVYADSEAEIRLWIKENYQGR